MHKQLVELEHRETGAMGGMGLTLDSTILKKQLFMRKIFTAFLRRFRPQTTFHVKTVFLRVT